MGGECDCAPFFFCVIISVERTEMKKLQKRGTDEK